MSDRRRIVTISPAGTVTTLEDFEDNATLYAIKDTFTVKPGDRQQNMAQRNRRYGGARTTFESHGNGAISWTCLVRGTTADNVFTNVEDALSVLEQPRLDLFFEWRPDGATNSVYYEIRGPATWTPKYSWVEFLGAKSMQVDISIPVAPLARKATQSITFTSGSTPRQIALGTSIGGRAPALADLNLTVSSSALTPAWALVAWTKRPTTTTVVGADSPFGIFPSGNSAGPNGWSTASDVNSLYGSWLVATTSGAGTADATFYTDPATMQPDDFSDEIVLEVWARYAVAPGVVNPRMAVAAYPSTTAQSIMFSPEWGANGRPLVKPSSGTGATRLSRLGTVTVPIDTASPSGWNIGVIARWDAGSTGAIALDYLVFVPARQRACSPSGKPLDSTFPKFLPDTSGWPKTIRSDLSGRIDSPPVRDSGLGGSPIELPPGTVNLFLLLSNTVPDDPTPSTTGTQAAFTVSGSVKVTPREYLASD